LADREHLIRLFRLINDKIRRVKKAKKVRNAYKLTIKTAHDVTEVFR
jgi:hypothetical protein